MSTGRLLIAVVSPSFTSVLDHGRGPRGLSHATQSGHISNSLTSPERFISGNRPEKASPRWPRWSIASEAVHRIAACSVKNQARPQPVAGSFPPSRPPPGSPSTLRRSLPLLVDLCSPTLSGTRGVAQGWGQRLASFAASSLLKVPPSHFLGRGRPPGLASRTESEPEVAPEERVPPRVGAHRSVANSVDARTRSAAERGPSWSGRFARN